MHKQAHLDTVNHMADLIDFNHKSDTKLTNEEILALFNLTSCNMATTDTKDEDSFVVLGTSPGPSLEMNGIDKFYGNSIDANLDDALKDLSMEANLAFKAHFKLADGPSPTSLMAASTIITDDKSTEELQKRFGELLDENVILKETLKQNNDSMKEQFLLIASCQEDMMKTHVAHKEKFAETRELVEKLRQENKKLKLDMSRLSDSDTSVQDPGPSKSGPSSAVEFVSSPDDDTIHKLTAQLDLVEKQRRQVIVENEKLTWQKESLEHIVDATSKERDDLKEKVKALELQLSSIETEYVFKINALNTTIRELQNKLQVAKNSSSTSSEEITKRDTIIQQLEAKISSLQNDLKNTQLKILEQENVKLEFSKHKSGTSDTIKVYKDQIQELSNRLKEAQTTVFQPVRFSLNTESDSSETPESARLMTNVKLYDKTLKHLAQLLDMVTQGSAESLVETLGAVTSLHEFRLERSSAEQVRAGLGEVKARLEKLHTGAVSNNAQVKGTLSIFEGIFKDYQELLKKSQGKPQDDKPNATNVEALTSALLARSHEIEVLKGELRTLKADKDDGELMKAQLELYKSDFEAEREAREKMACEKENIMSELRQAKKRVQELNTQMDEVRRINPSVFRSATAKRPQPAPARPAENAATGNKGPKKKKLSESSDTPHEGTPPPLRFPCPVCDQPFKTLILLQQHVDTCLL